MTIKSFEQVLDDDRISEIIIMDDKSEAKYQKHLKELATHPKIKLILNDVNLGCYRNKREAIFYASNPYVIIFDSDNVIDRSYIDSLFAMEWQPDTILSPDFAQPHFNYTAFSGLTITKENVKQYIPTASKTRFDCLMNTMNYFVHRETYLSVWDGSIEPWTADTIFQNYNWLKAGNKIKVVPGMRYFHDIHENKVREEGSHYKKYVRNTGNLYKDIERKLMQL
jgi:glycosyltransferase involved in cell wall biosynthesis